MPRTKRLTFVEIVKRPNEILETRYTLQTFMSVLQSSGSLPDKQMKVLEFCARCGLIANSRMCDPPCLAGQQMSLIKDNSNLVNGHKVSIHMTGQRHLLKSNNIVLHT